MFIPPFVNGKVYSYTRTATKVNKFSHTHCKCENSQWILVQDIERFILRTFFQVIKQWGKNNTLIDRKILKLLCIFELISMHTMCKSCRLTDELINGISFTINYWFSDSGLIVQYVFARTKLWFHAVMNSWPLGGSTARCKHADVLSPYKVV